MFLVAIFVCIGWIFSVCLHEFGHAIVAYWGGDTSVKDKGYLTLNPLKYTELNLSLILPLIFLLMGGIALPGAAVYINQSKLRNRWWQSGVSAAGPLASIVVAFVLARLFQMSLAWRNTEYWWFVPALACLIFLQIYVTIINSLPIPSLDGYGVIEPWLPRKIQRQLAKYNNYGFVFLFILLWFVKPVNLFLGDTATAIAQWLGVPDIAIAAGFALFQKSSGILLITAIGVIFIIRRFMQKPHEYWYNKAQAFSESGRYEKAIAAYDRVLQTKRDRYEIWDKRGKLLSLLKQYEEAIASYDRAIQLNPKYTLAWYNKACCYAEQNSVEQAIQSLKQAIALDAETVKEYAKTNSSFDPIRKNPLFNVSSG